jgi:hypothetical protein
VTRLWRWICWALDWECPSGEPDFAKMMQAATQFGILLLLWREKPLSAAIAMMLVFSAHGTRVLMAAIKAGVFKLNATAIDSTSRTTETRAGRDEKAGIELTP